MSETYPASGSSELPELGTPDDELTRFLMIQEGMERELVDSGITAVMYGQKTKLSGAYAVRFYPYKREERGAVTYIVAADVYTFDGDKNKADATNIWSSVGIEKQGQIVPLDGFEPSHALLVASMIRDLEQKRAGGELPNLNKSCVAIDQPA